MNRNGKSISIFSALNASEVATDIADGEIGGGSLRMRRTGKGKEEKGGSLGGDSIENARSGFYSVKGLSTSICRNDNGDPLAPCMKGSSISSIFDVVAKGTLDPTAPKLTSDQRMNTVISVLGCNSEKCVLEKPEIRELIDEDPRSLLKPEGPKSSNEWLSNTDIESVLKMYQDMPGGDKLGYWDCVLMDDTSAKSYMVRPLSYYTNKGKTLVVCIGNTGTGSSSGIHWVTMLVDLRTKGSPTVEFFDSTGSPPHREHLDWTEKMRGEVRAITGVEPSVLINKRVFQRKGSECGVYSLYYVKARLEGQTFQDITKDPIPDDTMMEFRTYLFSSTKKGRGEDEYAGGGKDKPKKRKDPLVRYYRIDGGWNLVPSDPF